MALSVNVNWEQPLTTLNLVVQQQRHDALLRRLRGLTRNGILNFIAAAMGAQWQVPANVANLDEAELRATYEGPLSAAYIALSPSVKWLADGYASLVVGDCMWNGGGSITINPQARHMGLSDSAAAAIFACIVASDSAILTPLP